MAVVVIVMGAMRLNAPIDLPTGPMLLAAAGGFATEFVSIYLLYRQQSHDSQYSGSVLAHIADLCWLDHPLLLMRS